MNKGQPGSPVTEFHFFYEQDRCSYSTVPVATLISHAVLRTVVYM